ncbi:hypothetical protein ACWDTP_34290 [Mycobacterium sp. NPDC003449]
MSVSSLPGAVQRAVLVKTAGGEGVLFSPTNGPRSVELGRSWSIGLRAAVRVPVVWSTADPRSFVLVDNPAHPVSPPPAIPGVAYVASTPAVLPSPVERACQSPSVEDYLALLEAGGSSHLEDTTIPMLLQAFALRAEQLSAHEFDRIIRLSAEVDDALIDKVRQIGPGIEYSAMPLYESIKRFHHPNLRGERLLNTAYVAAAHIDSTQGERGGVLRRRMAKRMADPPIAEAVATALRPWATVCGPLPGAEIAPAKDPVAPYSARDEQAVGMPESVAPASPSPPPNRPTRRREPAPRPRSSVPPPDNTTPRQRWWRRRRPSTAAALIWESSVDRHDAVLRDYLPFEIDPQLILAYPAAVDVQVSATRTFHEAAGHANALRTETGPSDAGHADSYRLAVGALEAAWTEAERHARSVGRGYLDQDRARGLERISALLTHADATEGAESDSYRNRAAELLRSQPIHRTARAQNSLDHALRAQLTDGQPHVK